MEGKTVLTQYIVPYWSLSYINASKFLGSSALNPGAVFLRFFTVAFLLFLTTAEALTLWGQLSNPAGQSLTFT